MAAVRSRGGHGPTWNVKANAYASNDPSSSLLEYGGTLPSLSTGTFTGYAVNFVASPATELILVDTASGPGNTCRLTSSGSGMVRKIVQQLDPERHHRLIRCEHADAIGGVTVGFSAVGRYVATLGI